MARTTLTPIVLPGTWSTTAQPITFTPADTTNNNRFLATGQEILLVRNTGDSAASFTVLSVPDSPYGRIGHLTHSVPPNGLVVTQLFDLVGWANPDGYIYVNGADGLEFAVLRIRRR